MKRRNALILWLVGLALFVGCRGEQCQAIDYAPYAEGLRQAGLKYPGAHVCESERSELLDKLAQGHSEYQARVDVQGHQGFDRRYAKIRDTLHMGAAEICAESWDWQRNCTPLELGQEMFKCWRQSPGHWSVASRKHRFAGYGMAVGRRGVWYATILVAD